MIEGYGFVQESPADRIDLAFNEAIHANIFCVSAVFPELMIFWVLHQAIDTLFPHGNVSLPDPFYMHYHNLETIEGEQVISDYLFLFFVVNTHTRTPF